MTKYAFSLKPGKKNKIIIVKKNNRITKIINAFGKRACPKSFYISIRNILIMHQKIVIRNVKEKRGADI
jgi:hypothetical protein